MWWLAMTISHTSSTQRNSPVIPFARPRIELAAEGGWYVIRGEHGWLHGDRRQAVDELDQLDRFERRGLA
jgi:hypothetical protein